MKRRITAALTAGMLSFGVLTVAAAPAHACVGVRCAVECIKQYLAGNPVCPD